MSMIWMKSSEHSPDLISNGYGFFKRFVGRRDLYAIGAALWTFPNQNASIVRIIPFLFGMVFLAFTRRDQSQIYPGIILRIMINVINKFKPVWIMSCLIKPYQFMQAICFVEQACDKIPIGSASANWLSAISGVPNFGHSVINEIFGIPVVPNRFASNRMVGNEFAH